MTQKVSVLFRHHQSLYSVKQEIQKNKMLPIKVIYATEEAIKMHCLLFPGEESDDWCYGEYRPHATALAIFLRARDKCAPLAGP
jgi:hypothetical protein